MSEDEAEYGARMRERGQAEAVARVRDVTITECQEVLRARADITTEAGEAFGGEMMALAQIRADTLRDAAAGMEAMRHPMPITVHLLHHGRALCGREGIPRDWPPGHRWVDISQSESVNCAGCRTEATKIAGVVVGR